MWSHLSPVDGGNAQWLQAANKIYRKRRFVRTWGSQVSQNAFRTNQRVLMAERGKQQNFKILLLLCHEMPF